MKIKKTIKTKKKSRLHNHEYQLFIQKLIEKHEEEKKTISKELHNEIAQMLSGINFDLLAISQESILNAEKLKKRIKITQEILTKSVDSIYRFARELRPMILDDLGLFELLRSHTQDWGLKNNMSINLQSPKSIEPLSDFCKITMYRIVQEALNNILTDSRTTQVNIEITLLKSSVKMQIKDNASTITSDPMSLLEMRARTKAAQGRFEKSFHPSTGSIIKVMLPLLKTSTHNTP
jgi:signal transduction histidine kinase